MRFVGTERLVERGAILALGGDVDALL